MRRLLAWIQGFAESLGGPGLFVIAYLDSSFLSFPQVCDALIVLLTVRHPERALFYALITTLGSVAGCYSLYLVGRKGGESFLRKRFHERHVDRALGVFRRHGILSVLVPSLMPPPMPFKIFVLAAGVSEMRTFDFLVAVGLGRAARYFGIALLALWKGQQALEWIQQNAGKAGLTLGTIILVGATAYFWWKKRQRRRRALSEAESGKVPSRRTVTAAQVLSVVIPAFNEERYIATTLERVLAVDLSSVGFSREVIVVDDRSTDRTSEIAATFADVSLHRLPQHAGKGGAVRAAVALARGDYLVIQDADLEYDPQAFIPMLRVLAETGADAVYGSRYLNAGRHPRQSRLAYLGGRSLSVAVKLLTGRWLSDVTTALKLLPLPLIRSLGLSSSGFELEAEITAKLLARGCRIVEVPVSYDPRTRREGKKVAFRDLVRSISALVRFRRG